MGTDRAGKQNGLYGRLPAAVHGDCLELLPQLPDGSIDMVLCDLPYSITQNHWDIAIPLEDYLVVEEKKIPFSMLTRVLWERRKRTWVQKNSELSAVFELPVSEIMKYWNDHKRQGLWSQYRRLVKPNGVIALFGAGMFSAEVMMAGRDLWRYNLIWEKNHAAGFLNANRMPLRIHEDILIFYRNLPVYHPQKSSGHPPVHSYVKHTSDGTNYGKTKLEVSGGGSTQRFPTSVWRFGSDTQKGALHPTQKPVALCEQLIKTYTNEGDVVLDNCAGSFTTAVACDNLKRNWIAIEKERDIFELGLSRVNGNRKDQNMKPVAEIKDVDMLLTGLK